MLRSWSCLFSPRCTPVTVALFNSVSQAVTQCRHLPCASRSPLSTELHWRWPYTSFSARESVGPRGLSPPPHLPIAPSRDRSSSSVDRADFVLHSEMMRERKASSSLQGARPCSCFPAGTSTVARLIELEAVYDSPLSPTCRHAPPPEIQFPGYGLQTSDERACARASHLAGPWTAEPPAEPACPRSHRPARGIDAFPFQSGAAVASKEETVRQGNVSSEATGANLSPACYSVFGSRPADASRPVPPNSVHRPCCPASPRSPGRGNPPRPCAQALENRSLPARAEEGRRTFAGSGRQLRGELPDGRPGDQANLHQFARQRRDCLQRLQCCPDHTHSPPRARAFPSHRFAHPLPSFDPSQAPRPRHSPRLTLPVSRRARPSGGNAVPALVKATLAAGLEPCRPPSGVCSRLSCQEHVTAGLLPTSAESCACSGVQSHLRGGGDRPIHGEASGVVQPLLQARGSHAEKETFWTLPCPCSGKCNWSDSDKPGYPCGAHVLRTPCRMRPFSADEDAGYALGGCGSASPSVASAQPRRTQGPQGRSGPRRHSAETPQDAPSCAKCAPTAAAARRLSHTRSSRAKRSEQNSPAFSERCPQGRPSECTRCGPTDRENAKQRYRRHSRDTEEQPPAPDAGSREVYQTLKREGDACKSTNMRVAQELAEVSFLRYLPIHRSFLSLTDPCRPVTGHDSVATREKSVRGTPQNTTLSALPRRHMPALLDRDLHCIFLQSKRGAEMRWPPAATNATCS